MRSLKYLLLISLLTGLILPGFTSAITAEELTAKIKDLGRQIEELKAQLTQLQAQPLEWCYDFNKNLRIENSGEEVAALHTALGKEGFNILDEEKSKKEFGESTASAVSGFQQKYPGEILMPLSLKYGTGFVGQNTRTKLNKLYGCGVEKAVLPPPTTPTAIVPPTTIAGTITPVSVSSVIQFVTFGEYAYGVTTDGSVLCWSALTKGGVATTKLSGSETPVLCSLKNIARIAPGSSHSCAVKTDGSAICWGSNQYGQLGNGAYSDDIETSPISVSGLGPGTTADIIVGSLHTCALKKDGSVVCWGNNGVGDYSGGQLGDGTNEPVRFVPTQVSGLGAGTVSVIFPDRIQVNGTCALKTNGTIVCWGESSVIGYSRHQTPISAPDLTPGTIKYLSINRKGFCALKTDDSVICSGRSIEGQLGGNVKIGNSIFTQVSGLTKGTTEAITSGVYYTCALKKDSSVICWGSNDMGQLGDGTIFFKYTPVSVIGLGAGTTAAISAGGGFSNFTCALKTDGFVVCWPGAGKTAEGKTTRAPALVPLIGQ